MLCREPQARADAEAARAGRPRRAAVRGRHGFTLLEILIALVILGVALTGLLQLEALGVRLRSQAQELTLATFLAQSRMTDVELDALKQFPELGSRSGDFGEAYPGYRWEVVVAEAPFPITSPAIREVRIRVFWPTGTREEQLELTSFFVEQKK